MAVSCPYRGRIVAVSWPYRVRIVAVSWPYRDRIVAVSWPYSGRIVSVSWPYRNRGHCYFPNFPMRGEDVFVPDIIFNVPFISMQDIVLTFHCEGC